ncbi:mitochondrial ribosomal subunit protein-domain-containing protein [Dipodascopsis uninucleata]
MSSVYSCRALIRASGRLINRQNRTIRRLTCSSVVKKDSKPFDPVQYLYEEAKKSATYDEEFKNIVRIPVVPASYFRKEKNIKRLERAASHAIVYPVMEEVSLPKLQKITAEYRKLFDEQEMRLARTNPVFDETDIATEEFEYDDLSPRGHVQMDKHRRKRELNRVAAWEMPLLRKHATPYRVPTSDEVFEFRYTSFMGHEHDAEAKVTVSFKASDVADVYFGDNAEEKTKRLHKLRLLARTRYNPESDIIHISSSKLPHSVQNKEYLVDTIKKLLTEAKDISRESFEDIPIDTRHIKPKKKIASFPEEWKRPGDYRILYSQ